LDISLPSDVQLGWLDENSDFAYLLTFPSNLAELLNKCEARGYGWPALRQVRTVSEPVSDELRIRCRNVLGVEIVDLYSTQELGYLALQRNDGPGYYALSDTHVVEVLADDGRQCRPGEIGRVVVTALHNFAMPLFRYDVGDLAEVGEPGPLPYMVINRIFGRVRNLLLAPDGTRRWPLLGTRQLIEIAPVVQHQFIQVSRDRIVVRLVVRRPVTEVEEQAMRAHLLTQTPAGIDFEFSYLDEIPRSPGGKFEDFVCEVS
jgi:phenylacetate-CoA ligase